MKFIIGGAYQGKLDYAIKKYRIRASEIADGEELDINVLSDIKCVNNYHLTIKKLLENGEKPVEFTKRILAENPDIIIIMNEIGNGIIPIEKSERIWREQVGKTGCFLAANADTVERVSCGIAVIINK